MGDFQNIQGFSASFGDSGQVGSRAASASLCRKAGLLQEENHEYGSKDKPDGAPAGVAAEFGFNVPSLVFAEERFRPAGDGAAYACGTAGLQQDDGNDDEAQEDVKDIDDNRNHMFPPSFRYSFVIVPQHLPVFNSAVSQTA
jgi:hypothetical protein